MLSVKSQGREFSEMTEDPYYLLPTTGEGRLRPRVHSSNFLRYVLNTVPHQSRKKSKIYPAFLK